jgi:hypothetical protein
MPEKPPEATLCDRETFEGLKKEMGPFFVSDVFPIAHESARSASPGETLVPRRRILPVYPSSWGAQDEQIPWLLLFQSLDERLNQMMTVLGKVSRREAVVLPKPSYVQISGSGLMFGSHVLYEPDERIVLLLDLPVFPPVEIETAGRVLGAMKGDGQDGADPYRVVALFEKMSPRFQDQLVQYIIVRQREEIQEVRSGPSPPVASKNRIG